MSTLKIGDKVGIVVDPEANRIAAESGHGQAAKTIALLVKADVD